VTDHKVCRKSDITVHTFRQTITGLEKKGADTFFAALEVAGEAGNGRPSALVEGSGTYLAIHFTMSIVFIFQF